jgi:uncharacterized protein
MGLPAEKILHFYLNKAGTIFPEKALGNLKHWYDVKYRPDGLEAALKEVFGDRLLGESIRPLIIPAFYAKRGEIYLFKTPHHKRLLNDWREKVSDVARATAAAPTYLAPFTKESGMQLVDGGVWANNPVMVGISEGLGYCSRPQNTIAALRIGSTRRRQRIPAPRAEWH